jgi:DNA replication initiation complex subunit (GINS family)
MDEEILEKLSELEHEQWCRWAGTLSKELYSLLPILDKIDESKLTDEEKQIISNLKNRLERWDKLMIPYDELSEEDKEKDRVYARRNLSVIDGNL